MKDQVRKTYRRNSLVMASAIVMPTDADFEDTDIIPEEPVTPVYTTLEREQEIIDLQAVHLQPISPTTHNEDDALTESDILSQDQQHH
jgi:hypothetical protein